MRIAVAGGTGLIGAMVAGQARERGHDVRVLARTEGVDVATGAGLKTALPAVDVVIDVLNRSTMKAQESIAFFTGTTSALLAAEQEAGARHHIALSIVGVDRAPYDYYAGKRAQEQLIETGAVPWTILRATQFHEFAATMYSSAKIGPVHLAPRMRTQPVAAREVAARLVELAEGSPVGHAEIGGPREESLVAMVRGYARATGHSGWIPAVGLPGPFGRAQRDGTLLPGADAPLGKQTFAQWLETL